MDPQKTTGEHDVIVSTLQGRHLFSEKTLDNGPERHAASAASAYDQMIGGRHATLCQ